MTKKLTTLAVTTLIAATPFFAGAAILNGELDFGTTSSDVTSLQTFLAADPGIYPEGFITGYFGHLTLNAVKRYQAAHNIPTVGRVGPMTLATINGWTGTGGTNDINASLTTSINVTTETHAATITWTSNEEVFGRVMYATNWPFLYTTARAVPSTFGFNSTQTVTLTGLQSNTKYFYVLESRDIAGNVTWIIGRSFTTK
jgi:peptidoglycan hydrolase-like protein with peptidoglycan-binding domain